MTSPAPVLFDKVLVANRGEIAVRVIRALKRLDIATVAVHSEIDAQSVHVSLADESVLIGGNPVAESYLRIDRIIAAALETGAQAIHPGYGLLAENPALADACEEAGIVFIGPPASAMRAMGSKIEARRLMQRAGVPVVPGVIDPVEDVEQARSIAESVGYPVVVKASGAGGGKGMRVARNAAEIDEAFEGAAQEGARFFGDSTVYIERYLENPRHIEVQVMADSQGSVVHLFERDCSVQRRHQKLVEESPAPALTDEMRERIGRIAVQAAKAVDYRSVGTVEGLYVDGSYFFLEMNTRIQVEHPVTEMVTGVDLVEEQIMIAAGRPLSVAQNQVSLRGHAIECRINAEEAARNFLPQPGVITQYAEPSGPHVRVDSGVQAGSEVSAYYDPLLAKVIVWAETRDEATALMMRALDDFTIDGVATLLPFHQHLLASPQWKASETCADLIEDRSWLKGTKLPTPETVH
ncbi:acetyl-CoA carboxylase biotin carboxylase subunit [Homoserinimonas sp. A447]